MKNVMFQAVTSSAGKSTLVAGLCRYYAKQGRKVAPFKAQNLSLNSFVTRDGGEIGMSQAYQAWAAGIEPSVDMNPILLKPKGGGMQLMLNGRPLLDIEKGIRPDREMLLDNVKAAYDRLSKSYDLIIIEGSGSPAEVNLRGRDIANMPTAEMLGAPVVLIGDIDKGGVFAGLYGTYHYLEERHRPLVKGFLINKFRGDDSILAPGIDALKERLSCDFLGIVPYHRLRAPAEDSMELDSSGPHIEGDDIRSVWLSSLDEFTQKALSKMDLDKLDAIIDRGV